MSLMMWINWTWSGNIPRQIVMKCLARGLRMVEGDLAQAFGRSLAGIGKIGTASSAKEPDISMLTV
jgi:hypothetical protein